MDDNELREKFRLQNKIKLLEKSRTLEYRLLEGEYKDLKKQLSPFIKDCHVCNKKACSFGTLKYMEDRLIFRCIYCKEEVIGGNIGVLINAYEQFKDKKRRQHEETTTNEGEGGADD